MITFNPGPSQLFPKVREAIQEILISGFLSLSHRSQGFMDVCQQAVEGLRKKMEIPKDYSIFFQPSATVSMDTLLKNVVKRKSFHFVHGAFSHLFFRTAQEIGLEAESYQSPWNASIDWEKGAIQNDVELIAITYNETSTGLMWPKQALSQLRATYPYPLLAVDVTSCFGAIELNFKEADLWFGSVQKCLGLPSGLGFLIVSPKALEISEILKKEGSNIAPWQRFSELFSKMQLYQTPETPNMLGIALLSQIMKEWDLHFFSQETQKKAQQLYSSPLFWKPYILNPSWRSSTVLNFIVEDPPFWHQKANLCGFILGEGYGPLQKTCIRLANFPALSLKKIHSLISKLK